MPRVLATETIDPCCNGYLATEHGVVTDTYTLQVTDSTIAIVPAEGTLTRPRELLFRRPAR